MDRAGLISFLSGREPEAIIRTLAMTAYNPAIGRVLEKGGVARFADLMVETIPKFYGAVDRDRFDQVHAEACDVILAKFKTASKQTLSYGNAQKPLNVFLKIYVDWASRPTPELADKLRPFLHVPLDSVLMKFMKREFPDEYETNINVYRRHKLELLAGRLKSVSKRATTADARRVLGGEFAIAAIDKGLYLPWQGWLRSLWPAKPVELDIIWALERRRGKSRAETEAAT